MASQEVEEIEELELMLSKVSGLWRSATDKRICKTTQNPSVVFSRLGICIGFLDTILTSLFL